MAEAGASVEIFHAPVSRQVRGVELLPASEVATRLTRMAVGELVPDYADGWQQRGPLVYGRQIDSFIAPCATEVEMRELGPTRPVAGFAVASDETQPPGQRRTARDDA